MDREAAMSARHRHHKQRIRECERDLIVNAADQDAIRRAISCIVRHGHHDTLTLQLVLDMLVKDRDALLEIMAVLAPNEWRWKVQEQWRERATPP